MPAGHNLGIIFICWSLGNRLNAPQKTNYIPWPDQAISELEVLITIRKLNAGRFPIRREGRQGFEKTNAVEQLVKVRYSWSVVDRYSVSPIKP
jgi:hypothetical protein